MFNHFGFNVVVGIDKSKIFAGSVFDASVAGAREALIFLADNFDTRVSFCVIF